MRKIIIILAVFCFFASCTRPEFQAIDHIKSFYPNGEIYTDGFNIDYFVIDEGKAFQFTNKLNGKMSAYPLKKVENTNETK